MHLKQTKVLGRFRRVTASLSALPSTAEVGDMRAQRTELEGLVTQLSADALTQSAGHRTRKAATQRTTSVRQTLCVHHMQPIAAMGKAPLHILSGYDQALRMPAKGVRSKVLVGDAGAMAVAVQPYATLFIQNGLAANFIARLTVVA